MGAGFRVQSSCQLWEVMCGRVWGELETVSIEERCVHSDLHTNCGVLLLCHRAEAVPTSFRVYLNLNKAFYMDG